MPDYKGLSPILRHALESFEHGIFHFLDGTEVGRKFALLHLDHAIELILKEKVVRLGHSIYRRDGKTIGLHEAHKTLEGNGVSIPEKPRLEDLHDFRNVVQHKGLLPDEHTTEFYVNEAYGFVKRFLSDEMQLAIESFLPRAYMKVFERVKGEVPAVDEIKRRLVEAENIFSTGAYETAIISAYVALELAIQRKLGIDKPIPIRRMVESLVQEGYITRADYKMFVQISDMRNRAAHTGDRLTREQAREALDVIVYFVELLSKK